MYCPPSLAAPVSVLGNYSLRCGGTQAGVDGEVSRVTEERGGVSLLAGAAWWHSQSDRFLAHLVGI
jgi:hypothetical protein